MKNAKQNSVIAGFWILCLFVGWLVESALQIASEEGALPGASKHLHNKYLFPRIKINFSDAEFTMVHKKIDNLSDYLGVFYPAAKFNHKIYQRIV